MNRPKKNARLGEPKRAALASTWNLANGGGAAKVFTHSFSSGNRATVSFGPDDPQGARCKWDNLPVANSDVPEYVEWRKMIAQDRADELQVRLLHVFRLPGGRLEMWLFAPGESPKVEIIVAGKGVRK